MINSNSPSYNNYDNNLKKRQKIFMVDGRPVLSNQTFSKQYVQSAQGNVNMVGSRFDSQQNIKENMKNKEQDAKRKFKNLFQKNAPTPKFAIIIENCRKRKNLERITQKIKYFSSSFRYRNLDQAHFNIIKDKSYYYKKNQTIQKEKNYIRSKSFTSQAVPSKIWGYLASIKLKINQWYHRLPVIQPMHKFSVILDLFSFLFIFAWFFIYCVHIAFQFEQENSDFIKGFRIVSFLYFFMEIIMRFSVGYYEKGVDIMNRKSIGRHYLQKNFTYDIIGLMVLFYNFFYDSGDILTYTIESLFFIKLRTFRTALKKLQYSYQLYRESSYMQQLLNMLFKMMILCHWIATLYHTLAKIEIYFGEENTWLHQKQIINDNWSSRYIHSFYWSISTALLIGAEGATNTELVFISCVLFCTVGIFAYLLSNISLIITELNKKSEEYTRDMEQINQYLRENSIPQNMQQKVRSHLEYLFQDKEQMKRTTQVKQVLSKLPSQLHNEIKSQINQTLIQNIDFFTQNFSKQTLQKTAQQFTKQTYVTNDVIINPQFRKITRQQDKDIEEVDIKLYIIQHGEVEIYFNNISGTHTFPIIKLSQGQIFGELNFMSGLEYEFTVKSTSFVTVHCISRNDFIQILHNTKDEYEKFILIQDQIKETSVSQQYQRKCLICNSLYHNETQCTSIQGKPSIYKTIFTYQFQDKVVAGKRQRYFRAKTYFRAYQNMQALNLLSEIIQNKQEFEWFIIENDINIHKYQTALRAKQFYDQQNPFGNDFNEEDYDYENEQDEQSNEDEDSDADDNYDTFTSKNQSKIQEIITEIQTQSQLKKKRDSKSTSNVQTNQMEQSDLNSNITSSDYCNQHSNYNNHENTDIKSPVNQESSKIGTSSKKGVYNISIKSIQPKKVESTLIQKASHDQKTAFKKKVSIEDVLQPRKQSLQSSIKNINQLTNEIGTENSILTNSERIVKTVNKHNIFHHKQSKSTFLAQTENQSQSKIQQNSQQSIGFNINKKKKKKEKSYFNDCCSLKSTKSVKRRERKRSQKKSVAYIDTLKQQSTMEQHQQNRKIFYLDEMDPFIIKGIEFTYYFPQNNIKKVIRDYNIFQKKGFVNSMYKFKKDQKFKKNEKDFQSTQFLTANNLDQMENSVEQQKQQENIDLQKISLKNI